MRGLYWGILAWGHGSTAWTSAVSKWFITWHLDQTCLSWIYWLLQTKPRTEWKPIIRFQFNSGLPCHTEKIIYFESLEFTSLWIRRSIYPGWSCLWCCWIGIWWDYRCGRKKSSCQKKKREQLQNLACKTAGFFPMYKKVQTFLPLFNEEEHQERREGWVVLLPQFLWLSLNFLAFAQIRTFLYT